MEAAPHQPTEAPLSSPLMLAQRRPEKAAELARHRRHGLVVSLPVRDQPPVSAVQPRLRAIGQRDHPAWLSLAPLAELLAHTGLVPIVPRRLDEQPPHLLVARLRDRARVAGDLPWSSRSAPGPGTT